MAQNQLTRKKPLRPRIPAPERALHQADRELAAAGQASDPAEQFLHAHLAALRSAAAVVEFRGRPSARRAKSVWEMLAVVEPDLAPWSVYFAAGAAVRAGVEGGFGDEVDPIRAAELIACAEDFRDEVALLLDPEAEFARPLSLVTALAS